MKRRPSQFCGIRSDMKRQVRLESGRIVSVCQIVDDFLKETVRRLRWYEPECDDGSPNHKPPAISGSTPLLQLNNVAFGVPRIDDAKQAHPLHFCGGNFSYRATACCNHGL